MNNDHIVAEIRKNSKEVIRITFSEFNGRPIAGARVWFKADDGTWRPGKSGIAFKIALLPAIADALTQTVAEARAAGLLSRETGE